MDMNTVQVKSKLNNVLFFNYEVHFALETKHGPNLKGCAVNRYRCVPFTDRKEQPAAMGNKTNG